MGTAEDEVALPPVPAKISVGIQVGEARCRGIGTDGTGETVTGIGLLVPGGHGQLGRDIAKHVSTVDCELLHAPSSAELDLTEVDAVSDGVAAFADAARGSRLRPIVINAAAYTAVDAAESDVDRAMAVNADGPRLLADACRVHGVPLLHVSTDYVFDGTANRPYEPDDELAPNTVYGRSKLAGEQAVLASGAEAWVVRTAWVYGAGGGNFVKTMARLEQARDTVSVVNDQLGSPTWSADLAGGLLELAGRVADRSGPRRRVLHCAGGGRASWYELARAVFAVLGADPDRVRPCGTEEFPRPAPRPAYSVLSQESWRSAGLTPLRPWPAALSAAFAEQGQALRP